MPAKGKHLQDNQDGGAKHPDAQSGGPAHGDGWLAGSLLGLATRALISCCLVAGLGVGITLLASCGWSTTSSTNEVTQRETKTFDVGFRPILVIHDTAGNVNVTPGQDGKVGVQVTKRIASGPNAERILGDLHVDMTQADNTLTIETSSASPTPPASGTSPTTASDSPAVDLALSVPVASQLMVEVGTGSVSVQQIAGQMQVTVTKGSIQAQDAVFSGVSQFTTGAGNVTLDGEMTSASMLQAQVQTGSISLKIPAPISAHLDARTQSGTVTVNGFHLPVTKVNGTGEQAVGDLKPGPTDYITLRVATGNITVAVR